MNLVRLFKSRKFWAMAVGLIVLVVREVDPDIPLPDEGQLSNMAWLIAAYILGVAVEDGLSRSG